MNTNTADLAKSAKRSLKGAEPELQVNGIIGQGVEAVKGFVGTYVLDKVSDTARAIPESYESVKASVRKRPILFASALVAVAGIGAYFYFRQPPGKSAKRNLH